MNKRCFAVILLFSLLLGLVVCNFFSEKKVKVSSYPNGYNFAFTITDDPDWSKLEKIRPIYDLLHRLGFKTTIAVWVNKPVDISGLPFREAGYFRGENLENQDYLEFILEFQKKGYEIAVHTMSAGNDTRDLTIAGYDQFKQLFGLYPKLNIMHSKNRENIYWGSNAFKSKLLKKIAKFYSNIDFAGEDIESDFFWGDICKKRTKYVRQWGTLDINTLKYNPSMPYYNPDKPYVNYWFSCSDGYRGNFFNNLIKKKNIDKLIEERGSCIVYTHFGAGFQKKSKSGKYVMQFPSMEKNLVYLASKKEGWFVPASTLLDRLLLMKNVFVTDLENAIIVSNSNMSNVTGVTILTKPGECFYDIHGASYVSNEEGEIVIGDISGQSVRTLYKSKDNKFVKDGRPNKLEYFNLIWGKLKIMLFSHRG